MLFGEKKPLVPGLSEIQEVYLGFKFGYLQHAGMGLFREGSSWDRFYKKTKGTHVGSWDRFYKKTKGTHVGGPDLPK